MTRTARHVRFLAGTALALALATPAFAQSSTGETQTPPAAMEQGESPMQAPGTQPASPSDAAPTMNDAQGREPAGTNPMASADAGNGPILTTQQPGQTVSDEIIGTDVRNPDDESIGTIDALVLDDSDRVVAGIVSVGGFLGIGAKDVAVSWDEFEFQPEDGVAVVMLSREQLKTAPAFRDKDEIQAQLRTEEQRRDIERQRDRLKEQVTPSTGEPAGAQ